MSSGSSVRKGSKKGQAGGQGRPRVEGGPVEGAPVAGVPAEPLTAIPEVEEAVGLPEAAAEVPEESGVLPVVEAVVDESAVVPVVESAPDESAPDESAPDQESHELEDEFPVSPVNYDEPGLFETWRDEGLYRFDAGKQ
ncbi:MAG TPA: hypothetical protein VLC09_19440, partial [Polyangiaceae bacterium]|nr:hypothetical protein [Polyangiaceae bacterium]